MLGRLSMFGGAWFCPEVITDYNQRVMARPNGLCQCDSVSMYVCVSLCVCDDLLFDELFVLHNNQVITIHCC